jgi:carboxypeptidase C (cathepsin A)
MKKKGTHLFFNTSGGRIKLGFYCRDNDFVENAINSSDQIEKYSQGLRLLNNPQFDSVEDAVSNAQTFINIISNKTIPNNSLRGNTSESIDTIDLNKLNAFFENYSTVNDELKSSKSRIVKENEIDEIEDFNNAILNFKNQKIEEVANYVEAGNPVLQFSNDNDVIDNYLISMVSGGNLTQSRLIRSISS